MPCFGVMSLNSGRSLCDLQVFDPIYPFLPIINQLKLYCTITSIRVLSPNLAINKLKQNKKITSQKAAAKETRSNCEQLEILRNSTLKGR